MSKPKAGFHIEVSNSAKLHQEVQQDKEDRQIKLLGDEVLVVYELPDGSEYEAKYRTAHTVEKIKNDMEDRHNLPYDTIDIFIKDRRMPDPYTLADFNVDLKKTVNLTVRIRVDLSISESVDVEEPDMKVA